MSVKVIVIIPAFNEEDSIVQTLENIKAATYIDYIVINDGSTDQTSRLLDTHRINHIDLPINLGIGGAMQTGYRYALNHGYDYAIQLDADGQHNPSDLVNLVEEITRTKFDMIIGSRFVEKSAYRGSLPRRIGIYYFYRFIHILTRLKITDPTSGYRIVNRKVIESFSNYYPTDFPEVEVLVNLARRNFKIKEIKVEMNQRQGGKSSITPKKSVYYMFKVTYISLVRSVF